MLHYLKGDATNPAGEGKKFIVHVCNDVNAWGAGFVLALSKAYPQAKAAYHALKNEGKQKLHETQFVSVGDDITVCNMIAQHGLRSAKNPQPLDYDALDTCLHKVAHNALAQGASIHMPRIGCGLAGGKWDDVSDIIVKRLCSYKLVVYVYDL
jgi:O-acetyl-ADP-ribose deacetylase (regulator of RNase III)